MRMVVVVRRRMGGRRVPRMGGRRGGSLDVVCDGGEQLVERRSSHQYPSSAPR